MNTGMGKAMDGVESVPAELDRKQDPGGAGGEGGQDPLPPRWSDIELLLIRQRLAVGAMQLSLQEAGTQGL